MIDVVVFDLGGTLIDYAGDTDAWPDLETPGMAAAHAALEEQGVPLPPFAAFRAEAFAVLPGRWQRAVAAEQNLTVAGFLRDLLDRFGIVVAPETLAMASERYQDALQANAEPLPGAQETLARLKADGYRLGLISNTMFTGRAHRRDLEKFGLDSYFDAFLFSGDVNKWKPNPAPFRHVLAQLDADPAGAVFVGDDPAKDVVGAQRAGMRAVHFPTSQRFRMPPGTRPDAIIHHLAELPPLLKNWNHG